MSSFCPGLAKGGSSAVIITTAAFFSPGLTVGGQLQPEARGDRLHRLDGIFEIVVARARQADDDAVAGQLVGADALEAAEILDAVGRGRGRDQAGEQQASTRRNMRRVSIKVAPAVATRMVKTVLTISAAHQNGLMTEKKRPSQPWRLARATSPLPV